MTSPTSSLAGTIQPEWFAATCRFCRKGLALFLHPVTVFPQNASDLRADLVAGLTVAVIMLPQAMAYALIADLPPQMGLYAAIVGSIAGALWGSSSQLQTGPTNAASLLVLATLTQIVPPDSPDYVAAVGLLTLMVGVFRLLLGLAQLGRLVAFVSDSVVVGFTAGAGVLIFFNQLRNLLGLAIPSSARLYETIPALVRHISQLHWPTLVVGMVTIAVILLLKKLDRRLPGPLIAIVFASLLVALLKLDQSGVRVVGSLPRGLPPLADLPLNDLELIGRLSSGALAIAVIGLVEALSIARSISGSTGQRLDSNQEFFGQGMANIACALFSGYTCSGSFTRSMVNLDAGARTRMASVFAGLFVLATLLLFAPLANAIPMASLAGVLMIVARRLVDWREMARIWRGGNGDRVIMAVTFLAAVLLPLQWAVLSGILVSLGLYLRQTTMPRVRRVLPDESFKHFEAQPARPGCPQVEIVEILGDLYFGAVNHVEDQLRPDVKQADVLRFLLLRLQSVENCDISGIHMLERVLKRYRELNGDIYLVKIQAPVLDMMQTAGFLEQLGPDHVLPDDQAISYLFQRVLDPAICVYECPVRAFSECQNLPKALYLDAAGCFSRPANGDTACIGTRALWKAIATPCPPLVIDVREPREYRRGHIAGALSIPMPELLMDPSQVPSSRPVVLVCRGGRRSGRSACLLCERGYDNVSVLQGGMLAWEADNLLEAFDEL